MKKYNFFIPAAGFGKRMNHLTKETPKPLLKIAGYPMIDFALFNSWLWQPKEIFINTHFESGQLELYFNYLKTKKCFTCPEKVILGTAGGIKTCLDAKLNDNDFVVVINPDMLLFPEKDFHPVPKYFRGDILLYLATKNPEDDYTPLALAKGKVNFKSGNKFYIGLAVLRFKALKKIQLNKYFDLADVFKEYSEKNSLHGREFPGKLLDVGDIKKYEKFKNLELGKYLSLNKWKKFREEFFPVS